jgi:N-terminal domain of (some) glycogen debranching enzymes
MAPTVNYAVWGTQRLHLTPSHELQEEELAMPGHRQTTHAEQSPPAQMAEHTHPTTPEERQERKQRIQTHGRSSVTRSIIDAIVIKAGDMFFLSEPNGRVPLGGTHGYGLYYHDCRFLNGYELKLAQTDPDLLAASADRGFMSITELTTRTSKRRMVSSSVKSRSASPGSGQSGYGASGAL